MLFSADYRSTHKQEADEIKCPYNQLGILWKFIQENSDKRINVMAPSNDVIEKLIEQTDLVISIVKDNYTVTCGDLSLLRTMLDRGYHACLKYPVVDWESFDTLAKAGVSDIYIDGPLGFQCNRLAAGAKEHDVKIRVSPSISPNTALSANPNYNSFFIRPEDLHLYEPYIDIVDFHASTTGKEDTLFQIYKRGIYLYDLGILIDNLNMSIDNYTIAPEFAEHRLNCKQSCKIPGGHCQLCETQLQIASKIKQLMKDETSTLEVT